MATIYGLEAIISILDAFSPVILKPSFIDTI